MVQTSSPETLASRPDGAWAVSIPGAALSVWVLVRQAFMVLREHMVLAYPFIALLILLDMIQRQGLMTAAASSPMSGFLPPWALYAVVMVGVIATFVAGWLAMAAAAVRRMRGEPEPNWQTRPDTDEDTTVQTAQREHHQRLKQLYAQDTQSEEARVEAEYKARLNRTLSSLALLKQFVPGVGAFTGVMIAGGALNVLVGLAIVVACVWQVAPFGQVPDVIVGLWQVVKQALLQAVPVADAASATAGQSAQSASAALKQWLNQRSIAELNTLFRAQLWVLAGLLLSQLWQAMTVFWAPLVVLGQRRVLQAHWQSLGLFVRHALPLVALGLAYGVLSIVVMLSSAMVPWVGLILGIALLYVQMALAIFVMLFVADKAVPLHCAVSVTASSDEAAPADESKAPATYPATTNTKSTTRLDKRA